MRKEQRVDGDQLYPIEQGVPIPVRHRQAPKPSMTLRTMRALKVGESFVMDTRIEYMNQPPYNSVAGAKFASTQLTSTTKRVWRIE